MANSRSQIIAALDLGSSKVCCFIARIMPDDRTRVIGIGHQVSRGVKAGAVVDMDLAEESLRAAVEAAERMAGETVGVALAPHFSRLVAVSEECAELSSSPAVLLSIRLMVLLCDAAAGDVSVAHIPPPHPRAVLYAPRPAGPFPARDLGVWHRATHWC